MFKTVYKSTYEHFTTNENNTNTQRHCGYGLPWNRKEFKDNYCTGVMETMPDGDIKISGSVYGSVNKVTFWAAAPPTYGTSFSGSGLPYPDPIVAHENTPNRGSVNVENGKFTFTIKYPNAYYIGLGTLYVPPHVNIKLCEMGKSENDESNKKISVKLDDGIPFRTLTYPAPPTKKPRTSPLFYCEPWHGARTQEAILRSSGYPSINKMPDNFWGLKPPR